MIIMVDASITRSCFAYSGSKAHFFFVIANKD